jgi:hypothetical protein
MSPVPSFYTTVIQTSPAFHSTTPVRDVNLLEPVTRDAVAQIIKFATQAGVTLQVLETYRSAELQQEYYRRGVTQLQQVGVHHYGLACDLGIVVAGEVNWKANYDILGNYAKQFGLVWGGDWGTPDQPHSFRDYDHVQRIAVADQPALFAGTWYPAPSYRAPAVG